MASLINAACNRAEPLYSKIVFVEEVVALLLSNSGTKAALEEATKNPNIAASILNKIQTIRSAVHGFIGELGNFLNKVCPNIKVADIQAQAKKAASALGEDVKKLLRTICGATRQVVTIGKRVCEIAKEILNHPLADLANTILLGKVSLVKSAANSVCSVVDSISEVITVVCRSVGA